MAAVLEKLGLEGIIGFDGPSVEQPYLVRFASDFADAAAAVEAELSAFIVVQGITLVFQSYRFRELGTSKWEFVAKYGRKEQQETNSIQGSFDATGGTGHITQSIATVEKYFDSGETTVYDFGGAIGVSNEGVEGTDIETPGYLFQYTVMLPVALWTPAYRAKLRGLRKKVNDAAWENADGDVFAAGECRFRGFQSSRRGFDDVELTLLFHAEENRTGITVGAITGIAKKGQEYMWVRYADRDTGSGAPITKYPIAVYIEQVYYYGNFADLDP